MVELTSAVDTFIPILAEDYLDHYVLKINNDDSLLIPLIHHTNVNFYRHCLENSKVVIFDVDYITAEINQFILYLVSNTYHGQILLFLKQIERSVFLLMRAINEKPADFNLTLVSKPENALVISPVRHIMYMIDNLRKHWFEFMGDIIQCTNGNVAIFCNSDVQVNQLKEYFDSKCRR